MKTEYRKGAGTLREKGMSGGQRSARARERVRGFDPPGIEAQKLEEGKERELKWWKIEMIFTSARAGEMIQEIRASQKVGRLQSDLIRPSKERLWVAEENSAVWRVRRKK